MPLAIGVDIWSDIVWLWGPLLTVVDFVVGGFALGHVVLNKRDVRAAIGWCGVIVLAPFVGALLYFVFGVNRLERRARWLRRRSAQVPSETPVSEIEDVAAALGQHSEQFLPLVTLVDRVVHRPITLGNQVKLFDHGDDAYDAMRVAIRKAKTSVSLASYIFDNDRVGRSFVDELKAAKDRGVDVRVLIDGVGLRYSWPTILGTMRSAGVPYAIFLPTLIPWALHYTNLRNHRKLLVVDGRIGFTGGMNIRDGHSARERPRHPAADSHCQLEGPVVRSLQETFAADWSFQTGETLSGPKWFPRLESVGSTLARGVADGPDIESDKIRLTLMGAIACARKSLYIVTPYFLPDSALVHALNVADLRGVDVNVILPEVNNLRLVQWASTAQLWQILKHGVRVWLSPPPFDHSKLMTVDDQWCFFGSANWDPRSLRLNFEFNVECHDSNLAADVGRLIRRKMATAKPITLKDVDGRSLPIKLRDGFARLLTPYL